MCTTKQLHQSGSDIDKVIDFYYYYYYPCYSPKVGSRRPGCERLSPSQPEEPRFITNKWGRKEGWERQNINKIREGENWRCIGDTALATLRWGHSVGDTAVVDTAYGSLQWGHCVGDTALGTLRWGCKYLWPVQLLTNFCKLTIEPNYQYSPSLKAQL